MSEKNDEKWTRAPSFKKYYATIFGLTHSGRLVRLDIGNEKVKFSEDDIANVSECQIIMDKPSFTALRGLFKRYEELEKEESEEAKEENE